MKKEKSVKARFTSGTRKLFLAHLSETANVAASERAAGLAPRAAYAERRRSAAFRSDWADALAEGYARLEADLLADALLVANSKTNEQAMKARVQKNRQGINLLNWHRGNVRGAAPMAPRLTSGDLPVLKAQLTLKLASMRERAGIGIEGGSPKDAPLGGANAVPPC
jgi:hypothetical protein